MQGKFGDLVHAENLSSNGQSAEALCRSELIRLCTFFGKRKSKDERRLRSKIIGCFFSSAIEVICSHLTTLLSHPNWRVRATIFDSLVTVASYIGVESEIFIQPIMDQVGRSIDRSRKVRNEHLSLSFKGSDRQ